MNDPEINAIQVSYTAIKDLDDEAKQRVIKWLISKFALNHLNNKNIELINETSEVVQNDLEFESRDAKKLSSFVYVAELFGSVEPKTDMEKALVVSAFLQEVRGEKELTSRLINDELKHLGHGSSNITTAIGSLISRKPNLMIQTRKEGKTKQAQKKYKVTNEGLKFVLEMFNRNN